MESKRKKTLFNVIMVVLILVIAGCGVMAVGNLKGWFDKGSDSVLMTKNVKGVANIQRNGVGYGLEKNVALRAGDILETKKEAEKVFIHDLIYQYTTDLVNATRKHQYLTLGVSPRGTLALINMASAHAYLQERDYVVPADVAAVFTDVCAHRLILNTKAKVGGLTAEGILEQILKLIPQPKAK